MIRYETTKPVFRHASDHQCCDCGRACAQMIISSLAMGAANGGMPTPSQASQLVPVRQDILQSNEADNLDRPNNWFTTPDELHAMLVNDQTLIGLGLTDWRIADCKHEWELWNWISASIKRGMPAVLNIKQNDHWVCVTSVTDDAGALSLVEFLDPLLPAPRNGPAYDQHTYLDACATDGTQWWDVVSQPPSELAQWELAVGSTPPPTYQGRFVAIVYGPAPKHKKDLRKLARMFVIKKPGPPSPEHVRELLDQVARTAEIRQIAEILEADPTISLRFVHDISGAEKGYAIAAVFSRALKRGLVAIFDEAVTSFLHLRLTSNQNLTDSIASSPVGTPLWWKRGLSTLYSPYFPFEMVSEPGQTQYRRLIDGEVLKANLSKD